MDRAKSEHAVAVAVAVARTGELGHGAPAALAVAEDEADELLVLLRRPRALLQPHLVAARLPTHRCSTQLVASTAATDSRVAAMDGGG